MTDGNRTILVDTNLLVYAVDPANRDKQARAQDLLGTLAAGRGAVSVQVLGEFVVSTTRRLRELLDQEDAMEIARGYLDDWRVFELTPAACREAIRAMRRYQLPYWDALIWATALVNGVQTVLSEDFSDGQTLEGVRFANPFATGFQLEKLKSVGER